MTRNLNILAVSGLGMTENDTSPYWDLMKELDALDHTTLTERAWGDLQDSDITAADVVVCYSWGCASVFKAFDRLIKAGLLKTLPLLIIMAGVPRGLFQCLSVTFAGGWTVPDQVGSAICFQVNSWPRSWPISNSGATRINRLITSAGGWEHISIQDAKEVHDTITTIIQGLISGIE